jgi:spermidine/putrescine transport system substrate-binding protein
VASYDLPRPHTSHKGSAVTDPKIIASSIADTIRTSVSRRRVLQTAGIGGAALAAAACGAGGQSTTPTPAATGEATQDPQTAAPEVVSSTLIVSNWPLYIDIDEETGTRGTLEEFQAQTGLSVTYNEDVNDNNEFYAKVRTQLEQGQPIARDLVVLTDWMATLWIQNGFVQELDKGNIPNFANLNPAYLNVAFDPGRNFSLPWQSGFGALGWNTPLLERALGVSELNSVDQLWDPALKGRVTLLSEMRDTVGILLAWLGYDPSNFTDDQFSEAIEALTQQVNSGQVRQVTGNDYAAALENGDVIAVIGWSGDMFQLGEEFGVALPESGGMLWTDNMLIPVQAASKANAEAFMNFYYDPEIAARVAEYVQYISPVEGAREAMESIDPELVDNPWIFPTEKELNNSYVFMSLTPEQNERYTREFQRAIGN